MFFFLYFINIFENSEIFFLYVDCGNGKSLAEVNIYNLGKTVLRMCVSGSEEWRGKGEVPVKYNFWQPRETYNHLSVHHRKVSAFC